MQMGDINECELTQFLIVGDRFAGFTVHAAARSVSQMVKHLQGDPELRSGQTLLRLGHGVSPYDLELLRFEIQRQQLMENVSLDLSHTELAGRRMAHKCRENNVLIADLELKDSSTCAASLRVHNDNEILLDHQTGQHVQGMVAVEASRQMFLASTEKFFLPPESRETYYFVINELSTRFLSFLFPLPATIIYRVKTSDQERPDALRFTASIEIRQGETITSTTDVDFTAFASNKIDAIETKRADAALQDLFTETAVLAPLVNAAG
jgi:hypothetical protein